MITVGELIKDKYRVERVLGEGGMGFVVAAHHVGLDQKVAIKFLHAHMLADKGVVERFAREARAASKLKSDHVARVVDVDVLPDGTPFIVMEYLEGTDLQGLVSSDAALPVGVAVACIVEACDAIGEAHRRGIVHRDIKPANLFLADLGGGKTRVKVLDFGISKMDAQEPEQRSRITRNQSAMGTAEYMSPEQMRSARDVDARTDIWALGVSLYELFTRSVPFSGESFAEICTAVMSQQPPPPSRLRPDVPAGLDVVVLRCLEKDPARRYASIDALVAALAPFAASGDAASGRASVPLMPAGIESMPTVSARQGAADGTLPSEVAVGLTGTTAAVLSAAPQGPSTIGAVSSGRRSRSGSSILMFVVGGVVVLGLGGGALALALRRSTDVVIAAPPSPPPTAAASASGSAPPPVVVPSVAPADEASAAPSAVASAPAQPSAALREPRHTQKPNAGGAARPNCDPAFTVDGDGIKHVKRECFR
jgi:eukaryotic-like serine/threonine-protein kinase